MMTNLQKCRCVYFKSAVMLDKESLRGLELNTEVINDWDARYVCTRYVSLCFTDVLQMCR